MKRGYLENYLIFLEELYERVGVVVLGALTLPFWAPVAIYLKLTDPYRLRHRCVECNVKIGVEGLCFMCNYRREKGMA